MIWNPPTSHSETAQEIASHIAATLSSACGPDAVPDVTMTEEVARSIAAFLKDECGVDTVDSSQLVMLASQALTTLGEGEMARRLLVFGGGLVQPAEWEVTGASAVWVLDLKRMVGRMDCPMELVFFRALNIVLDSISEVWDGTGGRGVLGLRHVCATASELLGRDGAKRDIREMSCNIKRACGGRLVHIRSKRGWSVIPVVMDLDL